MADEKREAVVLSSPITFDEGWHPEVPTFGGERWAPEIGVARDLTVNHTTVGGRGVVSRLMGRKR
jgi:hypothetical protein